MAETTCWFLPAPARHRPTWPAWPLLVRQRFPNYTPEQVADYLKENAEQRESPDPNNTWGHGFAQLPTLSPVDTLPTLTFADMNWDSVQIQNRIASYIAQHGYGYSTNLVPGSTLPLFQGLRDGDIDVSMEVWLPNQQQAWDEALAAGEVFSPGTSLGNDWQSAFVIPAYLQEQYQDLDSVQDLKEQRYKDLFKTADTGQKGRLVSCVIGWACEEDNRAQVAGYGLDDHVHIVNPGSGSALHNSIYNAYEGQEPWLGYQWGTSEAALLLDLVRLEEPAYSDQCWRTTKACAYRDSSILIGVNSSLPVRAPEVVEFLRKWDFNVEGHLKGVVRWKVANSPATNEDAALYWLEDNVEIWSDWVSDEAATRILAELSGTSPPASDPCGEALSGDGTVTGTWAAGCESEARTGSYARYYTFTVDQESDVTITLARTSGGADTYLNLWSGSSRTGSPLDDDDDTPDTSRSEITRNLAAGDYTVEATTFEAGETGSFTLTVSGLGGTTTEPTDPDPGETDSCGEALSGDGTVTGTWAAGCESEARTGSYARYYTFTVDQESDVTITLARTSGGADTYLNLWSGSSRTGSPLDDDDDTPDTSRSEITRNLAAGDYTVEATTFEAGETGSFTLTVSGLGGTITEPTDPDPGETDSCGEALSGDGTVTGTWAAGCESEARTGSYARYYTFTVDQESDVTITLARTSGGADTYLNLWSGSSRTGSPLDDDDDTPDTSRSEITRNLAAGDYTVEATTFEAGETGSFTLTVSGLGGTTTEPTDPDPGETDSCGEALSGDGTVTGTWAAGCESEARTGSYARYYTFTVDQESDVTITLARTSGGADTYLNLWSGSSRTGSPLDYDDDTPDTSGSEITLNLAAGDYTIEATTFDAGETGSFTLTVSGLGGTITLPTGPRRLGSADQLRSCPRRRRDGNGHMGCGLRIRSANRQLRTLLHLHRGRGLRRDHHVGADLRGGRHIPEPVVRQQPDGEPRGLRRRHAGYERVGDNPESGCR